jgi:hypothetical protein
MWYEQQHPEKFTRALLTWAGRSEFRYSGSVTDGITIRFGNGFRFRAQVSAEDFAALLKRFSGLTVKIGTSRDAAPAGSLGAWLREHVTRVAIASYVGPVLIAEGYAERGTEPDELCVRSRPWMGSGR